MANQAGVEKSAAAVDAVRAEFDAGPMSNESDESGTCAFRRPLEVDNVLSRLATAAFLLVDALASVVDPLRPPPLAALFSVDSVSSRNPTPVAVRSYPRQIFFDLMHCPHVGLPSSHCERTCSEWMSDGEETNSAYLNFTCSAIPTALAGPVTNHAGQDLVAS